MTKRTTSQPDGPPAGEGQGLDRQVRDLITVAREFPAISDGQAKTGEEQARRLAAVLAPLGVAALARLAANLENTVADETCRKAGVDLLKFHNGESLNPAPGPTLPYYSNDDLARHALENGGPTE